MSEIFVSLIQCKQRQGNRNRRPQLVDRLTGIMVKNSRIENWVVEMWIIFHRKIFSIARNHEKMTTEILLRHIQGDKSICKCTMERGICGKDLCLCIFYWQQQNQPSSLLPLLPQLHDTGHIPRREDPPYVVEVSDEKATICSTGQSQGRQQLVALCLPVTAGAGDAAAAAIT